MSDMKEQKAFTPGMMSNNLNNQPIWSDWSTENAIQSGMKSSTYVYACVDRLMKSVASIPWNAYVKNSKGEWEEAHDHPLEQLIQNPNPFMSRKQLMEIITAHLYLGGNAVLQKIKVRDTTVELWPISPDSIKPVPSKTDFIKEYRYNKNGHITNYAPDEIAHFMFIDPSNVYWGMSPLLAGARTVDTDVEAVKWNKVALQNRAITDGVFSFDNVLTQDQWDEARKQVRDQHQGSENARTPWVLGSGAKWNQMSLSPVEMDFLNSRKMTREEICSIFQVPPPMVGIYENATLANIETARKILWVDTVIPLLDGLQEVLNRSLAKEFSMDGKEVWLGYDITNVQALQENMNEKITNAQALFSMGVPFNMINARLELGFDAIESGDSGYMPMNLMPTSFKPSQEDDDEDEEEKSIEFKFFNLETPEQKAMHWKRVDDRRKKWESKVGGMIEKQFIKESKGVIKAFKGGDTNSALKAIDKQAKDWETMFAAFYTNVMEDFGDETSNSIEKSAGIKLETKFDAYSSGAQEWIKYMVGRNIKNIGMTTKERLQREISLGFDAGEDSGDIAARIKGLYSYMGNVRSHVIARTEVGSAMNAGSHFAAEQTGLDYERVWLSSMDDRTRDTHSFMDGIAVKGDESFDVNGSEMMFPGDSSLGADAAEIINCRCVETFEVRR